jgi:putative transposase
MEVSFMLERNLRVRIEGSLWILRKKVTDDCWQLENVSNGRIMERTRKELHALWDNKQLVPVFQEDDRPTKLTTIHLPQSAQETIDLRLEYVRAVEGLAVSEKQYQQAIDKVWKRLSATADEIAPRDSPYAKKLKKRWDWTTVYRWKTRHRWFQGDPHSLLNRKRMRHLNLPFRLLEILEESLDTIYLKRERRTLRDTLDHALDRVRVENETRIERGLRPLPKPTFCMLARFRKTIPAFDQYAARYGRQAAIVKFRSVKGHVITSAPLERVEIDHTPIDLFVVDDNEWLPLGRPYLTVCIDDYTRCVLGIYIGFVDPSFLSLALCLKNAFRPKGWMRDVYPEVENIPEIYGQPMFLVVDQAFEFHAHDFVRACMRLGITVVYSGRRTPWHKGKIERLVGTINREVSHGAPGTTFSNIFEKGDYNPEGYAVVRLSTLKQAVHQWVYDVYHQRKHRALGMPPAEMWAKSINLDDIPLPEDAAALDVILGREHDRVLTHKGIEYEGLFYNSDDLEQLRRQFGYRLDVRISVDESNIGSIHVLHEDKVIQVPALKKPYAEGISLWQHKKFKENSESSDPDGWLKAKERIRKKFYEEFRLKGRRPKKIGRHMDGATPPSQSSYGSASSSSKTSKPPTTPHHQNVPCAISLVGSIPTFTPIIQPRKTHDQTQV